MIGLLLPLRLLDVVPVALTGPPGCGHMMNVASPSSMAFIESESAQAIGVSGSGGTITIGDSSSAILVGSSRLTVEEC